MRPQDPERGEDEYQPYDNDTEREALLTSPAKEEELVTPSTSKTNRRCSATKFASHSFAFVGGVLGCLLAQYALRGSSYLSSSSITPHVYAGSTERHHFPPTSPTNAFPSLFPTSVGYTGGTPTGDEPALLVTGPSYPIHTGAAQLVVPSLKGTDKGKGKGKGKKSFDLFKKWGNLSPWYSVKRTAFGLDSSPEPPETCRVTGLHFLHRHGARYPTAGCKWANYGKPDRLF
jgi:hypothetical protein